MEYTSDDRVRLDGKSVQFLNEDVEVLENGFEEKSMLKREKYSLLTRLYVASNVCLWKEDMAPCKRENHLYGSITQTVMSPRNPFVLMGGVKPPIGQKICPSEQHRNRES